MIEKRINFSVGGRDGPASGGAPGPGDTGGEGGYGRDTNQRGNIGSSPTSTGGGDNQFTGLTKDVLNPNVDYVGDTVFGPTQKYSGDGIFSGYRNIDPLTGQPKMGLAYVR
jgi:hypothetical protein